MYMNKLRLRGVKEVIYLAEGHTAGKIGLGFYPELLMPQPEHSYCYCYGNGMKKDS